MKKRIFFVVFLVLLMASMTAYATNETYGLWSFPNSLSSHTTNTRNYKTDDENKAYFSVSGGTGLSLDNTIGARVHRWSDNVQVSSQIRLKGNTAYRVTSQYVGATPSVLTALYMRMGYSSAGQACSASGTWCP